MAFKGGCDEALKSQGFDPEKCICCSSCHEDQDYGYFDLMSFESGEDWYEICCAAFRVLKVEKD